MNLSKVVLFLLCLSPLAFVFVQGLGANPVERLTQVTGNGALNCLWATLAVTPLQRFTRWSGVMRYRRMLGLFCFFYAVLHFFTYLYFDHGFELSGIAADVSERPFIALGFLGFVLLVPLAVTSTKAMRHRLGGVRWKKLHRLVYLVAIVVMAHFFWLIKADYRLPLFYAGALLVLYLLRLPYAMKRVSV